MIADKIESNVLIPYLQSLYDDCDENDGYWSFLERIHPRISYCIGETDDYPINKPQSFLFEFILQ
jgi:hypothetical protein